MKDHDLDHLFNNDLNVLGISGGHILPMDYVKPTQKYSNYTFSKSKDSQYHNQLMSDARFVHFIIIKHINFSPLVVNLQLSKTIPKCRKSSQWKIHSGNLKFKSLPGIEPGLQATV
jgi:hypothetical protein